MMRLFLNFALSLTLLMAVDLFIPSVAFSQTEKLGIVSYTPPKGWTKTPKENVVGFADFNRNTGKFCIVTLYGATPGTGRPESDFKREWNNLVVKTLNAETNPQTETQTADGWTITAGGAPIEAEGGKSLALLTVFSGGGKTVSVLGLFNDDAYTTQLAAFVSAIELDEVSHKGADKPIARREESSPPVAATSTAASMHAAALVREFENNEIRANQEYVGKRMQIHGTVNIIEINKAGQIVLTFKSSITTSRNARCYFSKSQVSRVSAINANEEATVEGTVRGLGDGFDNSKAYLVLENCLIP